MFDAMRRTRQRGRQVSNSTSWAFDPPSPRLRRTWSRDRPAEALAQAGKLIIRHHLVEGWRPISGRLESRARFLFTPRLVLPARSANGRSADRRRPNRIRLQIEGVAPPWRYPREKHRRRAAICAGLMTGSSQTPTSNARNAASRRGLITSAPNAAIMAAAKW